MSTSLTDKTGSKPSLVVETPSRVSLPMTLMALPTQGVTYARQNPWVILLVILVGIIILTVMVLLIQCQFTHQKQVVLPTTTECASSPTRKTVSSSATTYKSVSSPYTTCQNTKQAGLRSPNDQPSVVFQNLPPNSQQCFVVTGKNDCGEGPASAVQCIQLSCTAPSAPTNLSSRSTMDQNGLNVSFQWSASTNASVYDVVIVQYGIDPSNGSLITTPARNLAENVAGTSTINYTIDAPIQSYRVIAKSTCGANTPSEPVSTSQNLPSPTNLRGVPVSPGSAAVVTLTWDAVDGAIGYWVIRKRTDRYVVTMVNANRLENVSTENYTVFAVSAIGADGGSSPLSNYVPMCQTPNVIDTVALNQTENDAVTVTWSPVANASSYRIYQGNDRNVSPTNYTGILCYPPGTPCT